MSHPQRSWHPKKLANSKWTAVLPQQREKHFIVVAVELDAEDDAVDPRGNPGSGAEQATLHPALDSAG